MSEPAEVPLGKQSWSVQETWTVAALFLGTVLSRFPFRSQVLYHWDAVNFAFAMQRFDVAVEQPQPPGYIAYVWCCRLVDYLFHDPQTTMVWLSIVGSGLAVVAMYLLGRVMFGRWTGLVAALFLASSPLFWFYGEIALPHALDTFLVLLSAWLLYEVLLGRVWALVPAAVSLAVAGGVRQQTPVFLMLLALFAGVRFLRRVGWRRGYRWGLPAGVFFGILCTLWFLPLINSVGGLVSYREIADNYSNRFYVGSSVFHGAGMWGLSRNLRKLGMYTLYGWSVGLLPLAVYGLVRLWRRQLVVRWERALFLLAWVFPSLCFYTLIHMGQQGLVFVFLPVLLLVSARALVRLAEGRGRAALAAGLALLVVVNAALFVALPEYPLGRERFKVLSWDTLCNNDAYYQERFDAIREHFPAESTVIIAVRWRHVEWYLPEYVYLPFAIVGKWEMDAGSALHTGRDERLLTVSELGLRPDDGGQVAVILFDPELRSFNLSSAQVTRVALRGTGGLDIMTLTEEQQLFYGEDRFGLRGD
jgi:4-amino-4-deoxy-L-arabinose transferase-like glycosyltransferase